MDKLEKRFEAMLKRQEKLQSKKFKKIQDQDLSARNPLRIISKAREKVKIYKAKEAEYKKQKEAYRTELKSSRAMAISKIKTEIPTLTKDQASLMSTAFKQTTDKEIQQKVESRYPGRKAPFKEKHPVLYALGQDAKKTARETFKRTGKAFVKEVESIGRKRISASRLNRLVRPKFSPRERRLKYRPMASNILLANSY